MIALQIRQAQWLRRSLRFYCVGKASHPSAWWASRVQDGTLLHVWPSRGECGSVLPDTQLTFALGSDSTMKFSNYVHIQKGKNEVEVQNIHGGFLCLKIEWHEIYYRFIFFLVDYPEDLLQSKLHGYLCCYFFNINEECHLKLFFLV